MQQRGQGDTGAITQYGMQLEGQGDSDAINRPGTVCPDINQSDAVDEQQVLFDSINPSTAPVKDTTPLSEEELRNARLTGSSTATHSEGHKSPFISAEAYPGLQHASEGSGRAMPTIYVIGERLATIHHVLDRYGMPASRTANMAQFDRRRTSPDAAAMLQAMSRNKPQLVWIQWCPRMQQPGRRAGVRNAIEFFSGLIKLQLRRRRS